MAHIKLGKVSITPRGEYSATTTYDYLDCVQYMGSSYLVKQQCKGINPEENEYYMLLAQKGSNVFNANLIIQMVCPTNKIIEDDQGLPGAYVQLTSQKLSDLLTNGDSIVHPAFMVNDVNHSSIFIGKFQGSLIGTRIYSLPSVDPQVYITLDTFEQYCKNKGVGHHHITAAEWAFLALWCKKNGTLPKGNNNYGKDTSETLYKAVPTSMDNGKTERVATGTGPVTWSHDGTLEGVWDLNGNVWEWCTGLRLVYGELQVIPYNNAASPDCDTGPNSAQWKAVNAAATSWEDLFITPGGSGTTANSVKLDHVSGHWQWQAAAISNKGDARRAEFVATTIASDVSAIAALYLRAMALAPEAGDTDYNNPAFWACNNISESCMFRGSYWAQGGSPSMFYLNFNNPRTYSANTLGGRPAFVEL